jgi:7-carboxy-7-deazaguanine synthase
MNKLLLSEDGIFPIIKDKDGNLITEKPATDLSIPGTIQGEGKLVGTPSLFIRLANCNLCCIWQLPDKSLCKCDTNYTINSIKNSHITVEDAVKTIKNNLALLNHIVITGGEPMLQKKALIELIRALKSETSTHLTLETNGTLFDKEVVQNIDLISISPKLTNSNPDAKVKSNDRKHLTHDKKRINIEALQSFIDIKNEYGKNIQLKFVISSGQEEDEIKGILSQLKNLANSDIIVMPLGSTIDELAQTSQTAFEIAIKNGWRFSPRLQINLFNNRSGV